MHDGTIAAIATAPGRGGVAVVRISGDDAFEVAELVAGKLPPPGHFAFRRLDIDDVLVLVFKAPNSYTGEDVVEIQSHGGGVAPRKILDACFAAGARIARRGEFTERAFLNGKMDLSEAESVIELVDAKTDRAAKDARERLSGEIRRAYKDIYREVLEAGADLEHSLDVDETDLPPDFLAKISERLTAAKKRICTILARSHEGRILREGALVVLAGEPNAGKSSLMNALLGANRVIVSDIPGTTRDSIEEYLDLGGYPVRLVDTAGLRDTVDAVESEGIRRARELIDKADYVIDLSPSGNVHTKCDLEREPGKINVSAKTGEGLDELKADIVRAISPLAAAEPTPSERESSLLSAAAKYLEDADKSDIVLLAGNVRQAGQALAQLTGEVYSDDLLSSIFSRFCVGK
ncbi:MAG: tRNA uridine-5-carboxymethylaminomethyl(34) synthesis GTPase MnmE [Kiritimatiellae bacterium]|nr:tRNA uridine-5-carboxymethylaminomethyl(34) synthesis GTPase MnmE [Kiritimatiellia bacterium]